MRPNTTHSRLPPKSSSFSTLSNLSNRSSQPTIRPLTPIPHPHESVIHPTSPIMSGPPPVTSNVEHSSLNPSQTQVTPTASGSSNTLGGSNGTFLPTSEDSSNGSDKEKDLPTSFLVPLSKEELSVMANIAYQSGWEKRGDQLKDILIARGESLVPMDELEDSMGEKENKDNFIPSGENTENATNSTQFLFPQRFPSYPSFPTSQPPPLNIPGNPVSSSHQPPYGSGPYGFPHQQAPASAPSRPPPTFSRNIQLEPGQEDRSKILVQGESTEGIKKGLKSIVLGEKSDKTKIIAPF